MEDQVGHLSLEAAFSCKSSHQEPTFRPCTLRPMQRLALSQNCTPPVISFSTVACSCTYLRGGVHCFWLGTPGAGTGKVPASGKAATGNFGQTIQPHELLSVAADLALLLGCVFIVRQVDVGLGLFRNGGG